MASLNVTRLVLPRQVFGGGDSGPRQPIRQDQFLAEFEVSADQTGCYTFDVKLVEDDLEVIFLGLNQDEVIAANTSGTYECYCLQRGTPMKFSISTAAPPLAGRQPLAPSPGTPSLPPLEGFWPRSDAGGGIEVRLEIAVFSCNRPCGDGQPCGDISARDLGEDPVTETASDETEIDLLDGPEPYEVIGPIIQGVSSAAGTAAGQVRTVSQAPSERFSPESLALAQRVRKLAKEVRRLKRARARPDIIG